MVISAKSMKILWANAAGRCAFPGCRERLSFGTEGEIAPYTIGEMAHIKGERANSNRHDAQQDSSERNSYTNLILLCPNHHTLIDQRENEEKYSIDFLQQLKIEHENFILEQLEANIISDLMSIAKVVRPLLAENYQVWSKYGPMSEIAKKNPHSDQAHAIWLLERLSTIVPNNRKICELVGSNIEFFQGDERGAAKLFLLHAEGYERWVQNEISYQAVIRFPIEFDELIQEHT
jgi:HNH endonuclease